MVDKSKPISTFRKNSKIQGTTGLDFLVIIIVVLTVFAFLAVIILGPSEAPADTTTTARSATVSSTNQYPYTQPTITSTQSNTQPAVQGRAGFNNSVAGDINVTSSTAAGAATGVIYGSTLNTVQPQAQNTVQPQATAAYGISNGQVIGLRPLQAMPTPYIPTTAVTPAVTGRSVVTPGSNPTSPYVANGNAVINIETTQAYHPQNQELIMNQACVDEVWQRNPYVIRNFSNLSIRLSATNPTVNGNMRTYSFNLDNRPTGNGALCTVTTDGYVTAVSFY